MPATRSINTRNLNRKARPGLVDIALKEDIAADTREEVAARKRVRKTKLHSTNVKRLAALEEEIAEQDAIDDTPCARPTRQPCHRRPATVVPSSEADGLEYEPSAQTATNTEQEENDDDEPVKRKTRKRESIHAQINEARKGLERSEEQTWKSTKKRRNQKTITVGSLKGLCSQLIPKTGRGSSNSKSNENVECHPADPFGEKASCWR